jgi:hypothetical protein
MEARATDITTGDNHSCAIQTGTGNAICWGYDAYGQATPSGPIDGVPWTATGVVAGGNHTFAIVAIPEPAAWQAQLAGITLLLALNSSRARTRKRE